MSGVNLILQNIYKELSGQPVTWALANVGDKIRIETTFSVVNEVISSTNNPFTVNNNDGYIGNGWVTDDLQRFVNFNIGDYIYYYNYITNTAMNGGNFYIINKLSNGEIQLNTAANGSGTAPTAPADTSDYQTVISNQTVISGVRYWYNFIQNNAADTFTSKVDGVSQQIIVARSKAGSDTSVTAMEALGSLTWQDGLAGFLTTKFDGSSTPVATIAGISAGLISGVYTTKYKIVHYTKVSPYLLYNMTIPPFVDSNCLKLITQIDAMPDYNNPNVIYSGVFDQTMGRVGWYGENFNNGKTNYSISNVAYTNAAAPINSIQLDNSETTLTFKINNTVDTPFSNNNTQFVIGFFKVPADPSEYQGNNTLMDINFLYDRAIQTVGAGAVNGDNYGGTYQVLKSISAVFNSSSQITITVKFDMSAAVIASFKASSSPQYKIIVATQNYTLATDLSDLVQLSVAQEPFVVVTADPTMIVPSNIFIRHPEDDPDDEGVNVGAGDTFDVYPGDECVACSNFYIESSGRLSNVIAIKSVKGQIIAVNGSKSFSLDQFLTSLTGFPMVGYTQQFDVEIADAFHIPAGEIRKTYVVKRRNDLDTGTRKYFSFYYPFLFRWETWTAALGVDPSFFNASLPNNGFNEWWYQYAQTAGWSLNYLLTINATKDGVAQQYTLQQQIIPHNYGSNANFTTKDILPFDPATLTQLLSGSGGAIQLNVGGSANVIINGQTYYKDGVDYFYAYQKTLIVAIFTKSPAPVGYTVCIDVELYGAGGIYGRRRYSSKWVADADTWFSSTDGSGKVLTVTYGTSIIAYCYLDPSTLNFPAKVTSMNFRARIYEPNIGILTTDDGVGITTDDGLQIEPD